MVLSLADPRTLAVALSAELALGIVGVGVGWLFGVNVGEQLGPPTAWGGGIALGLLATLPMLAAYAALQAARWRPLARLRRDVRRMAGQLLRGAGLGAIAAVSLAAGLGEEILFRGALQPVLAGWLTDWGGVLAAGLLFGMAHPISWTYFWLAALWGVYLGALTLGTGDLLPAIVAHAAYDFVVLWRLRRDLYSR